MVVPFLSIGIPVRNEEESIRLTIESIISSSAWAEAGKENRELVICMNGTTDRTLEVLRSLQRILPELKIITSASDAGKTGAMNEIIKKASKRAREVYFSDADVRVEKDTIDKTLRALRTNPVEFAAPTISPLPIKGKKTATQAFYEESIAFAEKNKLHTLTGMGFAVKRNFLLAHPLPEGRMINDDRFINYAWPDKIKMVYGARVLFRIPTLRDHFRARVRHRRQKRHQLEIYPEHKRVSASLTLQRNPRVLEFIKSLSTRAKAGFFLNQGAEVVAAVTALTPGKDPWPRIGSSKAGYRK